MDLKRGDVDPKFAHDHLSSDLVFVWPGGFGGRDEFVKDDLSAPQISEERIDNVRVRFYGETAIADGTWYKKGKGSPDSTKAPEWRGFLMEVWVKRNGEWQLVSSAAGPLAPAASRPPVHSN